MLGPIWFLIILTALPRSLAQKCNTKADCKSKYSPHCSKWGYCQWTDAYGVVGKAQGAGLKPGQCKSPSDCNIRAPVCSKQGFCTDNGRGYGFPRRAHLRPKKPAFKSWVQGGNKVNRKGFKYIPSRASPATPPSPPTTSPPSSSSICTTPTGAFPHPSDCSLYYQCHAGTPVLCRCPKGFRWSVKRNYCDWAKNVECDKTASPTTEILDDIFENEAVSVNQVDDDEDNLIRNQRLTLDETTTAQPWSPRQAGYRDDTILAPRQAAFRAVPASDDTTSVSTPAPQPLAPRQAGFRAVPTVEASTPAPQPLAPRQAAFKAVPAVPGKPEPYERPDFNQYDAVPQT